MKDRRISSKWLEYRRGIAEEIIIFNLFSGLKQFLETGMAKLMLLGSVYTWRTQKSWQYDFFFCIDIEGLPCGETFFSDIWNNSFPTSCDKQWVRKIIVRKRERKNWRESIRMRKEVITAYTYLPKILYSFMVDVMKILKNNHWHDRKCSKFKIIPSLS